MAVVFSVTRSPLCCHVYVSKAGAETLARRRTLAFAYQTVPLVYSQRETGIILISRPAPDNAGEAERWRAGARWAEQRRERDSRPRRSITEALRRHQSSTHLFIVPSIDDPEFVYPPIERQVTVSAIRCITYSRNFDPLSSYSRNSIKDQNFHFHQRALHFGTSYQHSSSPLRDTSLNLNIQCQLGSYTIFKFKWLFGFIYFVSAWQIVFT